MVDSKDSIVLIFRFEFTTLPRKPRRERKEKTMIEIIIGLIIVTLIALAVWVYIKIPKWASWKFSQGNKDTPPHWEEKPELFVRTPAGSIGVVTIEEGFERCVGYDTDYGYTTGFALPGYTGVRVQPWTLWNRNGERLARFDATSGKIIAFDNLVAMPASAQFYREPFKKLALKGDQFMAYRFWMASMRTTRQRWGSLVQEEGPDGAGRTRVKFKEETLVLLLRSYDQYVFSVDAGELTNGWPVNAIFAVPLRFVNPKTAMIDVWRPLEVFQGRVGDGLRRAIGRLGWHDLLTLKASDCPELLDVVCRPSNPLPLLDLGLWAQPRSEKEEIITFVGFAFGGPDAVRLTKAVTEPEIAELEAKARIEKAKGEAGAVEKVAEAWKKVPEHLQGLLITADKIKVAGEKGNTIVFDADLRSLGVAGATRLIQPADRWTPTAPPKP